MPKARKVTKLIFTPIDPYVATLLGNIFDGKQIVDLRKGEKIFSQGDRADSIYFIQAGKVKISVVSAAGKEAVIAMLGPPTSSGKGLL